MALMSGTSASKMHKHLLKHVSSMEKEDLSRRKTSFGMNAYLAQVDQYGLWSKPVNAPDLVK